MADTLPNVEITSEWQAVSVLTDGAVAAGTGCIIQNQSEARIHVAISDGPPPANVAGIIVAPNPDRPLYITPGENEVWILTRAHVNARINVQVA